MSVRAALRDYEHDAVPRERIVFEIGPQRFMLYADRRLQTYETLGRIKDLFDLYDAAVLVHSDGHYCTSAGA